MTIMLSPVEACGKGLYAHSSTVLSVTPNYELPLHHFKMLYARLFKLRAFGNETEFGV